MSFSGQGISIALGHSGVCKSENVFDSSELSNSTCLYFKVLASCVFVYLLISILHICTLIVVDPAMLLDNILIVLFAFRTFPDGETVCRDLLPHLEETQGEGTEPAGK